MIASKSLVSTLLAAGAIGAVAAPLTSLAQVEVYLNIPPPVIYEVIPTPRRGRLQYDGSQQVWADRSWQDSRPEHVHSQRRRIENDERWDYQSSRWDRDGDGVANRHDRAPNDPRRN